MKQYRVVIAVMLLWSLCNAPRIAQPFKAGHDSYASSQWVAPAADHLKLGLGVTRGANVLAVNYSGKPTVYYSYSPLFSWLLAVPMVFGCPPLLAARLVAFAFFLWFLLSFWLFARNIWGNSVANVAVAVLAILPIALRYGLMVGQETMALGPTFSFLALYTSRQRRDSSWAAKAVAYGLISALSSWYNLVLIIPCMWAEWRRGNRRSAFTVGASVAGLAVLVPVGAIFASGIPVTSTLAHLHQRLGSGQYAPGVHTLGHLALAHRFVIWAFTEPAYFGTLAAVLAAGVLAVALIVRLRRLTPVRGDGWLLALAAYGMPFTLLFPNMATFHDFFMYLYTPLVAVCCALAVTSLNDRPDDVTRARVVQPMAAALLLVAIFATSTWLVRDQILPGPVDYQLRDLATALGRSAQGDTAMLGSVAVMGGLPDERLDLAHRDLPWPNPYVICLTGKTAYVCRNSAELSTLLGQLGPERPVVIVEQNRDLEPLPAGAVREEIGPFTVATWRTPARPATAPEEPKSR